MNNKSISEILKQADIYLKNRDNNFVESFLKNALISHPRNTQITELLAFVLQKNHKHQESFQIIETIIDNCDCPIYLLNNLATHFFSNNNINSAIRILEKIVNRDNKNYVAFHDLGLAHAKLGDLDNAQKYFLSALKINGELPEIFFNIGLIYDKKKNYKIAINYYIKAIEFNCKFVGAWINLGATYFEINCVQEALQAYESALNIDPINRDAWFNKGVVYKSLKKFDKAVSCFKKTISLDNNYSDPHKNLGDIYFEQKQYITAIKSYEKSLEINPKIPYIKGLLQHSKMMICDWANFDENLFDIKKNILNNLPVSPPFPLISMFDDPEIQLKSAKIWACDNYRNISKKKQKAVFNKQIKVAYFSSDIYSHATMHLLSDVLKFHDKQKFKIYGFNFSPINDSLTNKIKDYFDVFIDVSQLGDEEIADLSLKENIDIAVDLKGYTQNARPKIFAFGAAPIQVNFLGYPGTLGCNDIQYIIADKYLIPNEFSLYYSEQIIYLPVCYQPNQPFTEPCVKASREDLRKKYNLPPKGFIFCSFNSNYKITPPVLSAWANILLNTHNSFFWCMVQSNEARENLLRSFTDLGIQPNRLIFCTPLNRDLHLERLACADLFLDTFPCGSHTTASDSIRSGVPILTIEGKSFASRVCASLLNELGANFLITKNIGDYEFLATNFASNHDLFQKTKVNFQKLIRASKLFDPQNYAKEIELVFEKLISKK